MFVDGHCKSRVDTTVLQRKINKTLPNAEELHLAVSTEPNSMSDHFTLQIDSATPPEPMTKECVNFPTSETGDKDLAMLI